MQENLKCSNLYLDMVKKKKKDFTCKVSSYSYDYIISSYDTYM